MMATTMHRPQSPRSSQSILHLQLSNNDDHSFEYNHDQQPRSQQYLTSRNQLQNYSSSPDLTTLAVSSSSSNIMGEQFANLQRELQGDNMATSTSNPSSAAHFDLGSGNGEMAFQDNYYNSEKKTEEYSRSIENVDNGLEDDDITTSVGLFENPEVLALIEQTSHSEIEYDFNNQAAHQMQSSHSTGGLLQVQSHLDSSSTSAFEFPEMPASLLDQAPEYEYSMHTQTNVFDAVQNLQNGGDDQSNFLGFNNYDPALLAINPLENNINEGYWSYHDASGGGTLTQVAIAPELLTSFQDSSSLSDYPEPTTAPTSRGSDWKQDQITTALQNAHQPSSQEYTLKRRRESFDVQLDNGASHVEMVAVYEQQQQQHHQGLYMVHQQAQVMVQRDPRDGYMVPVHAFNGVNRGRVVSWGGEGIDQFTEDWPPPPAPAPGFNGHANASMTYPIQSRSGHGHGDMMPSVSMFAPPPSMSAAASSINDAMAARLGAMPSNIQQNHNNASRSNARNSSSAQNDMIDALGNAMDASMESEGVAKCPYPNCTKTFAKNRSYNLKAHLRSHSQLKPFACNHCPRAFSRKHDLERHARVHSGDKPYICEVCGKGFPRSDALRRHWRVEKECGEKAIEIESGQAVPSLSSNASNVAAHAKGPSPGALSSNNSTVNVNASMMMTMPHHHHLQQQQQQHQEQQYWEGQSASNSFMESYTFQQQPDRKRARQEFQ